MSNQSTQQTVVRESAGAALGIEDFARLFGTTADTLPERSRALIAEGDFRYRPLAGEERDRVLLDVLTRVDSGEWSTAGEQGKPRWEKGWSENLEGFRKSGRDLSQLVPKYIRPHQAVRLDQNYVMPVDPNFELKWFEIFQQWLFTTYFKDAKVIYEFGCGSGINLAALATLYPDKKYIGLDWTAAATEIVDEMSRAYGWNMKGQRFDFFHPDKNVTIEPGATIFTVGALEQTGRDHEAFLQYLLEMKPALCVNVEPIVEWYDENQLVDYAAIKFHRRRNYWEGFPGRLKELEQEGRVEILKTKRSYFGSLYLEGYSQLVWRPL
jgi:hypothetical protein